MVTAPQTFRDGNLEFLDGNLEFGVEFALRARVRMREGVMMVRHTRSTTFLFLPFSSMIV